MEQQTLICSNCQTPNPAKNLYCQSCGKPLVQAGVKSVFEGGSGEVTQVNLPEVTAAEPIPLPPFPQVLPPAPQGFPQQGYQQQMPPQGYPPQGMPQQQPVQQGYPPQSYPPQQPYYPPQAPVMPVMPKLEQLGARLDGHTDLIAGAADKSSDVTQAFIDEIKARAIPQSAVDTVELSAGMLRRTYQVVRGPAGSVAVYIGAAGKDLAVSWAKYVRRAPNWKMLGILAGIAFGISFLTAFNWLGDGGRFVLNWFFGIFNWLLPVALLALLAGYVWKGSFWYFFMQEPGEIAEEDLAALSAAVQQSLDAALGKTGLKR